MNTTDLNAGIDILRDLKRNAPINNKSLDGYLREVYKNKPTENTLSNNLNVSPLLYYDRHNLLFKNKYLDETKGTPQYDYEANGGRKSEYFISTNKNNYSTPPLVRTYSRY